MKIFQIGFNKCGTMTIHRYFCANGVRSLHWDKGRLAQRMFANLANGDKLLTGYEDFEAFSDCEYLDYSGTFLEGYKLFPYLAEQYPDAVFILNTRDREAWIKSRLTHGQGSYAKRYKTHHHIISDDHIISDEQLAKVWRSEWERHHRRVMDFFAGRTNRFFVCCIETDLPHILNKQLPEFRLDTTLYRRRKVTGSRKQLGFLRGCIKVAKRAALSVLAERSHK